MQPADGEREKWLVAPAHAHPHFAGDDEAIDQARIEQDGVKEGALLIEVHASEDVHLETHQIQILLRQDGQQLAHHQESRAHAELEYQRQIDRDERRRAPGDLHHRTEEVMVERHREKRAQGAEILRRVANEILRRQHATQGVVAHANLHRVFTGGAMNAQQSADAREHEPEADGNGLEAVGGDDHQE